MKLTVFEFILLGLAVFRVSLLVSKERGPADVAKKLRHAPPPHSNARAGLSCPWCVSIYASGIVVAGMAAAGKFETWWWTLIAWLSLSALSIIINQQWTQDKESK